MFIYSDAFRIPSPAVAEVESMRSLKGALLVALVVTALAWPAIAVTPPKDHGGAHLAGRALPARETLPLGTLPARPTIVARPSADPADTWTTLFADDFEGAFPGSWQIVNNGLFNDAGWGRWTCWSGATPTHSAGCAAGGDAAITCGESYYDNQNAWMVYGPFSLAGGITAAELQLRFKLECEDPGTEIWDYFSVMASADGSMFFGSRFTGTVAPQAYTLDLADVPEIGSLLGDNQVWIACFFHSDGSVQEPNGAQVDDVVLRVATASTSDNTVAIGSNQGESGTSLALPITLANDAPVKGLQFDVLYDDDVLAFAGASATGRAAGMVAASHVVSAGRARVVMYHDDAATVAAGTGEVGRLVFEVVGGAPAATSNVLPADLVLSDADGGPLAATGAQGVVTVAAATVVPSLQISVLRNPGRPRTFQVLVSIAHGSRNLPSVTVGGTPVPMSPLDGLTRFSGTFSVADGTAETVVIASDTNSQGPGTSQVTVTF